MWTIYQQPQAEQRRLADIRSLIEHHQRSKKAMSTAGRPRVNLNGTGRQELFNAYYNAWTAASEAVNKLALTCPHGRDYQTVDSLVYRTAVAEHHDRIRCLSSIVIDLYDLMEEIYDHR